MIRCVWLAALATLFAADAAQALTKPAKSRTDGRVYVSVEHFQWREYYSGDEILEEKGPLFGVGGEFNKHLSRTLDLDGRARLFVGEVDYDGAIQSEDGVLTPYESDSVYFGFEGELDLGRPYPTTSGITWKPFAGAGLRWWQRTLDTSLDSNAIGDYGYEENWLSLFGSIGIEAAHRGVYGRIALRIPFYNRETVDLSDQGGPDDVELEPGEEMTAGGELGYHGSRYFVAIYFENLDFSESDPDDDTGLIFQPESKARIYGIRGGLEF